MFSRFIHLVALTLFILIGLYLSLLGGFLLYLGGSFYYLTSGLVCLAISYCLIKKKTMAIPLMAALLSITLLWSLYEAELDLFALLPRLATWLVIGCYFFTSSYQTRLTVGNQQQYSTRLWIGLPNLTIVLLFIVAALQDYQHFGTGTVRALPNQPAITDWQQYGNTKRRHPLC